MDQLSIEDQAAASAVASLNAGHGKRERGVDSPDAAGGFKRL
jgi:hypothetical protein